MLIGTVTAPASALWQGRWEARPAPHGQALFLQSKESDLQLNVSVNNSYFPLNEENAKLFLAGMLKGWKLEFAPYMAGGNLAATSVKSRSGFSFHFKAYPLGKANSGLSETFEFYGVLLDGGPKRFHLCVVGVQADSPLVTGIHLQGSPEAKRVEEERARKYEELQVAVDATAQSFQPDPAYHPAPYLPAWFGWCVVVAAALFLTKVGFHGQGCLAGLALSLAGASLGLLVFNNRELSLPFLAAALVGTALGGAGVFSVVRPSSRGVPGRI